MTARETSLRYFLLVTAVFTAWRLLTTTAWLVFGPGLEPGHPVTQVFFYLSKAFLGGLFWPISLLIQGLTNPFGWLFPAMVKASVLLMAVLTVVIFMGLRWREQRMSAPRTAPRLGWIARQRASADRWVTAAAIAAIGTTVLLGGLHWLRVWQG